MPSQKGHAQGRDDTGQEEQPQIEGPGPLHPEAHGGGALSGCGVGFPVAEVVHHENGRDERPHADPGPDEFGVEEAPLYPHRSRHRHGSEEDEGEEIAEPPVGQGKRAPRVGHGADEGGEPDDHDGPSPLDHEVDAHPERRPQGEEGGPPDGLRGEEPGLHDPGRSHPGLGVAPLQEVEVVVRQIRGHLNEERPHEGRQGRPQAEEPPGARHGRSHHHRGHRRREGPGSNGQDPCPEGAEPGGAGRGTGRGAGRHRRLTTEARDTSGSRASASRDRRASPPGPARSCRRGGWRSRRAPGSRPVHRRRH